MGTKRKRRDPGDPGTCCMRLACVSGVNCFDNPAAQHVDTFTNTVCDGGSLAAGITSCDVSVDAPPQHSNQGNKFLVRVDVRIPGKELVTRAENIDPYIAAHDAVETMRTRLDEYVSKRRDQTRTV